MLSYQMPVGMSGSYDLAAKRSEICVNNDGLGSLPGEGEAVIDQPTRGCHPSVSCGCAVYIQRNLGSYPS